LHYSLINTKINENILSDIIYYHKATLHLISSNCFIILDYFFKVLISLISYSTVSYKQSTFVIRYSFKCSYTAHIYLIANFLGVCYAIIFVSSPQNRSRVVKNGERERERERERKREKQSQGQKRLNFLYISQLHCNKKSFPFSCEAFPLHLILYPPFYLFDVSKCVLFCG